MRKRARRDGQRSGFVQPTQQRERTSRGNLPGNLNQVLRRTVELYQVPGIHKAPAGTLQLEADCTATFDEAKMQQALTKILDNAIQAPGENRQIRVTTRNKV